jgi:hypothetical protein
MTVVDLQEAIRSFSSIGLEWNETKDWVSARQLRVAPPLGHLYGYLLTSNFLLPMANSRSAYSRGLNQHSFYRLIVTDLLKERMANF